jgi:methionyl-tRNA formyltransferase
MIAEIVLTNPTPTSQVGEPTVFKRRRPEEGSLAGLDDLTRVYDFIRMLDADGYPPAFIETDSLRFEFADAAHQGDAVQARVLIRRKKPEQ